MLIKESVSGYRHFDLGSIKLAFTQVCREEVFKNVYFAASSLYYVESGSALLYTSEGEVAVRQGELCLIRQHSRPDIRKFKDKDGKDFKSIIFYLFPDFVTAFTKEAGEARSGPYPETPAIIHLGKHGPLGDFCTSLLPLLQNKQPNRGDIKQMTFSALSHLSQHNKELLRFLAANNRPVKIDLYEFMLHVAVHDYSVPELARLTGRSLSAFKRDFHQVFETTPHQWILLTKMDHAEQLLRHRRMKASDIYPMLGFNELSHFSAAFKKIKGVSPTHLS